MPGSGCRIEAVKKLPGNSYGIEAVNKNCQETAVALRRWRKLPENSCSIEAEKIARERLQQTGRRLS